MIQPLLEATYTYTEAPDISMFNMHSHDGYELYCFLSGSAKYFVEGSIYNLKPGDILIMKKAESHSLLIDKLLPYERMVVNFNSEAILGEFSQRISKFIDNRPLGRYNKYASANYRERNFIPYIAKVCETEDFEEKRLYLTFILNEMCKEYPKDSTPQEIDSIKEIIDYINLHLYEDINLENISKKFYLSKSHLIRKFKSYTGSAVWEYITTKRLIYARELLQKGEKPTQVYIKCGFNDYGTFYRAYRSKYGASPNSDRLK